MSVYETNPAHTRSVPTRRPLGPPTRGRLTEGYEGAERGARNRRRFGEAATIGGVRFGRFTFGSIEIDGTRYDYDVVIDRGRVRKRKKGPSKPFRPRFGHTPLSLAEEIPWECQRLVVGSGADGALPVMEEVAREAGRRHIELVVAPTAQALEELEAAVAGTNAILHLTC